MAKAKKDNDDKRPIIIIKRIKKVDGGGHSGGSWKVAYADFVTAMMAFFLLLWLLSVTTDVQKKKIADYFSPTDPRVSQTESGAGGVLSGTTLSAEGAKVDDTPKDPNAGESEEEELRNLKASEALDRQDEQSFKEAEEDIREAIEDAPELKEFMENLLIDMTPEGLRIQIVDQENKPMFMLGSANPLPQTMKLLTIITGVVKDLPNKISMRGHTDSKPYGKDAAYTNWELSADRANASRRVMHGAGLENTRFENVQGKSDREHLLPEDPLSARNRRITIVLLKQSIVAGAKKAAENFKRRGSRPEPKKREEGVIYFP